MVVGSVVDVLVLVLVVEVDVVLALVLVDVVGMAVVTMID